MATSSFVNQNLDSDEEDDDFEGDEGADVDGENEPDDDDVRAKSSKSRGKGGRRHVDEDDEEDEEDDEDDEDEEEDDEEDQPARKRARRKELNQFIDVEAAVDTDEEDAEDEDDDLVGENGFIEHADEAEATRYPRDDHRHRELDRRLQAENAQDLQDIAAGFVERHRRTANHRGLNSRVVPRKLLLPAVQDPNIWGVRCKPGKEREVIFGIMRRCEELSTSRNPLTITSAFERGGGGATMAGYIYVEARKQSDVMEALQGIQNVYPGTKMILVPIKEMPDLLNVVKKADITPGMWVRYKRGKYVGDLAQVENVSANGLELRIRMVPRIEYNTAKDNNAAVEDPAKRKRGFANKTSSGNRPPQRLFSENEAKQSYLQTTASKSGKKCFSYLGEEFEDGYLVKDVKLSAVTTDNVNPSLEEVTKFASGGEDGTESLDLNSLAASLRQSSNSAYQPGDMVEVYDGEQQGLVGRAVGVQGDIVSIDVTEGDLKGTIIEVPFKGLRKRFREGDHVKVTGTSRYKGEVGMVVRIVADKVTLLSDMTMQEITVFSKDLRDAVETIGGGPDSKFDLHDLVQLDPTTVACVTKVDRESVKVLDQNGNSRLVMPSQISSKIDNRRQGAATDRNGSEIRTGDTVKEVIGEARQGTILHIFRSFAFLHSRAQTDNAGVFVCRTNNVATIIAKGGRVTQNAGPDLTKMNPALQRGGGRMAPPPVIPKQGAGRDKIIGQNVIVRTGTMKGLIGVVKDANDTFAKVELHSRNKPVNIPRAQLGFRDPVTNVIQSYEQFMGAPRGGNRGGFGGGSGGHGNATPRDNWSGSRTPVPDFQGNRTPAWMGSGAGARTPAWMSNDGGRTPAYAGAGGSKTPAWNDGSRTSYGGGNRTPAWNPGSRTPYVGNSSTSDRSAWDAGSKTPGRTNSSNHHSSSDNAYSSSTNNYNDSSTTSSYSARTPGAGNSSSAYNATSPDFGSGSSATPYNSAPTPGGNLLSAPTPGFNSAPTPAAISAPTPGASAGYSGYSAPTPAAYAAPTPGASGGGGRDQRGGGGAKGGYYEGAPTPAGGGGYSARTPGVWGGGDDDGEPRYSTPSP